MIQEFRDFISKGNVLDLAVAVIIGAAFGAIVTAVTQNVLMPIVGIIFGKPSFDDALIVTINNSEIRFGTALTALVNFLIIAFVLFIVVKAVNRAQAIGKKPAEEEEAEATEVELLQEIRDLLANRD